MDGRSLHWTLRTLIININIDLYITLLLDVVPKIWITVTVHNITLIVVKPGIIPQRWLAVGKNLFFQNVQLPVDSVVQLNPILGYSSRWRSLRHLQQCG
jgi:hypothetical protein